MSPPMRIIIKLALLTGQRRAEFAGAMKSELRLDGAAPTWVIPGATRKAGKTVRFKASPTLKKSV